MTDLQTRLQKNNLYYEKFAGEATGHTEQRDYSRAFDAFTRHLDRNKTVLDIGCGAGNHLAFFQEQGYRVLGIEPSAAMRSLAQAAGVPVIDGTFETLDTLDLPEVAGVWCAASLLHVPQEDVPAALWKVAQVTPSGAPLFLTVRLGQGYNWDRFDDGEADAERFIQLFDEPFLRRSLEEAGFAIVESWVEESTWGRPTQWISIIAERH